MDPTFIIKLIVRARNEIAGVMQSAVGDVDKLTSANERSTKSEERRAAATKRTADRVQDATKRFNDYTAALEKGDRSLDSSEKQLKSFQREFDRLGNRVKAGTKEADQLYQMGRKAEAVAKQIADARSKQADSFIDDVRRELKAEEAVNEKREKMFDRRLKAEDKAARARLLQIQLGREAYEDNLRKQGVAEEEAARRAAQADVERINRQQTLQAEIAKTMRAHDRAATSAERSLQRQRLNSQISELRDTGFSGKEIKRTVRTSYTEVNGGRDQDIVLTRRQRRIEELTNSQRRLNEEVGRGQGFFARFFTESDRSRLSAVDREISKIERSTNRGSFSASRFAGNLRAMVIVGAIAFFQQLVGAVVALGGSLVAVAGAAIQAGGALGGALTAGAAQALPVVGLLAAAWGRVGAVFDAVKQATKARQAAQYDDATAARKSTAAADAVRNAQEAVTNAQLQAADAQRGLTKARADAARQIQDLIIAEKQAQLAAEGAVLSQAEAQKTLRRSIGEGDISSLARQSLEVRSASVGVLSSSIGAARARIDSRRASARGVEGSDQVLAAKRAIDDANRGIRNASINLAQAKDQADDTIAQLGTADRLLQQLVGDLSPSEKRLYTALAAVSARYKKVFTGEGGVLESITDAFTGGAETVLELLENPRLVAAATYLAEAISKVLTSIFDALGSADSVEFFIEMGAEAEKNLPIIERFGGALFSLFRNIARAGSPAFTAFLEFLTGVTEGAAEATGPGSGLNKLTRFFNRGEVYAESFLKLTYAVLQLFGALVGVSAQEGQNIFDALTRKAQEATEWINSHQKETREFFAQAARASAAVLKAIGALTVALFNLFDEGQVEAFSDAFEKTLLPALEDVLKVMGAISRVFLEIAGSEVGSILVRLAVTALLLKAAIGPLITGFSALILLAARFFGSTALASVGTGLYLFFKRFGLVVTGVASAFLILTGRVDSFGDAVGRLLPLLGGLVALFVAKNGLGGVIAGIALLASKLPAIGKALPGLLAAGAVRGGAAGRLAGAAAPAAAGAVAAGAATRVASRAGGGAVVSVVGSRAVGVPAAAAAGAALTGAAATGGIARFAGLLRTSIITSLGIAVGTGLYRGFKNGSVADGIRDFGASLSLGIIDSVKETSSKLQNELAKAITPKTVKTKTAEELLGSRPQNQRQLTTYGGGATVPITTFDEGNPLLAALQKRYGGEKTAELTKGITGLLNGLKKLNTEDLSLDNKLGFNAFIDQARAFRDKAPRELTAALNILIQEAKNKRAELDAALDKKLDLKNLRNGIVNAFGIKLQAPKVDTDKLTSSFIKDLAKLPPYARQKAVDSALSIVDGLEKSGKITKEAAKKVRDSVTGRFKEMRDRTNKRAQQTRENVDAQMTAMGNIVGIRMGGMVEMVNGVLDVLGIDQIDASKLGKKLVTGFNKFNALVQETSAIDAANGNAGGGYIGMKGERGADKVRTVLGRGEAVLNWGHQRVVEPALAFAKRYGGSAFGSLDEVFGSVRGKHGEEYVGGMAGGGRVGGGGNNEESVNVLGSKPGFAVIMAAFKRMFDRSLYVMSGFRGGSRVYGSGRVSNHASGDAIDISNPISNQGTQNNPPPPNSLDRLYAYIAKNIPRPPRRDLLWRTMQGGNHFNHIHMGLDPSVTSSLAAARKFVSSLPGADSIGSLGSIIASGVGGLASTINFERIKAPKLGKGLMNRFGEAILKKLADGANNKLEEQAGAAGSTGSGGDIPSFKGPWVKVLEKIARSKDWSISDWKRLVQGESGGNPNARNPSSGAYGLGQFLGSTKDAYAKYGATSPNGADQIRAMAKYIADRYGTPTKALQQWLARSPHWYGNGGAVSGPGTGTSDSIPARLSDGEHVLTAKEVLAAGGHKAIYALRRMLGGGAQAVGNMLAKGGAPKAYVEPEAMPTGISGINKEINAAQKAISKLKSTILTKSFTDALSKSFDSLLGEDGLFDNLTASVTELNERLALNLKRATYKVLKSGKVIKALNDRDVAGKEIDNIATSYRALTGERGQIQESLRNITRRLKNPKIKGEEREVLKGLQKNLNKRLDDVRGRIADNLEARYNAVEAYIQGIADISNNRATAQTSALDRSSRLRGIFGGSSASGDARAKQVILSEQIRGLTIAADVAKAQGHGETEAALREQVAELQVQVTEAVVAGISGEVDAIATNAERRETGFGLRERIASALGRVGDVGQIITDRINSAGTQIDELRGQLAAANANGFTELASTIQAKIDDLSTSIVELTAQRLEDGINLVNSAADRANAAQDLRGRYADIKDKLGNFEGAFADRGSILGARAGIIGSQRNELYGLLNQATATGNQGQIERLTNQIADLDAQLAENTVAQRSNTNQLRDARINAITNRGGFLNGVFSGLGGILTSLGALNGTTDQAGLKSLLGQQGNVLRQSGAGYADQALQYGIDVRGMSPADIVRTLSSLDYDAIRAGMTDEEKSTFDGLINSIIENTTAQVDNTTQIRAASGNTNQSFTSSAWQWLRTAIFDGSGGLLPQYTNAGMGVTSGVAGSYMPTASTTAFAMSGGGGGGAGTVFAPVINNEEKTVDMDADTLANKLYFRYRNGPKTK